MFASCFVSVGLMAGLAIASGTPIVFPSLGPTAFLQFAQPLSPGSAPRNTVLGHGIGILCGYLAVLAFGIEHPPAVMDFSGEIHRVLAAGTSLAATCALMVITRTEHPPAAATTLIVSLGIVTSLPHLLAIEAAVLLLTLEALVLNRLAGIAYPVWSVAPAGPAR